MTFKSTEDEKYYSKYKAKKKKAINKAFQKASEPRDWKDIKKGGEENQKLREDWSDPEDSKKAKGINQFMENLKILKP